VATIERVISMRSRYVAASIRPSRRSRHRRNCGSLGSHTNPAAPGAEAASEVNHATPSSSVFGKSPLQNHQQAKRNKSHPSTRLRTRQFPYFHRLRRSLFAELDDEGYPVLRACGSSPRPTLRLSFDIREAVPNSVVRLSFGLSLLGRTLFLHRRRSGNYALPGRAEPLGLVPGSRYLRRLEEK
jgi:hypothetical protein